MGSQFTGKKLMFRTFIRSLVATVSFGSVADTHRCAESLFMKTLLNSG